MQLLTPMKSNIVGVQFKALIKRLVILLVFLQAQEGALIVSKLSSSWDNFNCRASILSLLSSPFSKLFSLPQTQFSRDFNFLSRLAILQCWFRKFIKPYQKQFNDHFWLNGSFILQLVLNIHHRLEIYIEDITYQGWLLALNSSSITLSETLQFSFKYLFL